MNIIISFFFTPISAVILQPAREIAVQQAGHFGSETRRTPQCGFLKNSTARTQKPGAPWERTRAGESGPRGHAHSSIYKAQRLEPARAEGAPTKRKTNRLSLLLSRSAAGRARAASTADHMYCGIMAPIIEN